MVTPPEALVERAWTRGLSTGRFKAVDDLLYHNVEAYTGMPNLFFSWVQSKAKYVHFEFLDNAVKKGTKPRTIAFGRNNEMVICDIDKLIDISRFQAVNIDASQPSELFEDEADNEHGSFLTECIDRFSRVRFVDPQSHECYALTIDGSSLWLSNEPTMADYVASLKDTLPMSDFDIIQTMSDDETLNVDVAKERTCTVGLW